jgi:hypothetical protein
MAQDNPYAKYVTGQAAEPAAPPPFIQGTVSPTKQAADNRDQVRLDMDAERLRIAQDDAARKARDDAEKSGKLVSAQESAIYDIRKTIDQIDKIAVDVGMESGWWETGKSGAFVRGLPGFLGKGTEAYDLAGNIKTIDAQSAFSKLQQMRENSPTGGALGNVTEKELDLLKSSVSNLDPDLSQNAFVGNLVGAKKVYLDMLRRLDPKAADEYANRKGIRFREDDNPYIVSYDGPVPAGTEPINPLGVPPVDGGGNPPQGGIMQGMASGVGDIVQGLGSVAGIIGNPLNATINAVTGSNLSTDLGATLRDTTGLPDVSDPTVKAINMGAAGGFGIAGAARKMGQIATSAPVRNALADFAAAPVRDTVAGATAGGAADIARRNELGPVGEVSAAVAGGLAGYKAAGVAGPRGGGNALMGALDRQGVSSLPADAGGSVSKIVTSGAKASPLSASPIRAQAQANIEGLSNAAERAAGNTRMTADKAGEAIRGAAERYGKDSRQRGEVMYGRAYSAAKGVKIKPASTIKAIDEQLARLAENPADNGAVIKELQDLRSNIEGGVSIQGLRDARTQLSAGVYDGKLRSSADQSRWKNVLNNVADDIENGLRSVGRDGAANQFRRADKFWKGRVEHIDEVLQPILGNNKGGEEIVQAVEAMARGGAGGNARLSRLLGNMDSKEAAGVRATIITRLGKAAAGAQDETGEVFSPATFLTNWNKMTPQAKASLFSDPAQRANLNDIALIASRMKATQSMANHSNTALATGGNVALGAAAAATNPAVALLGAAAQYATGKLMASPGFARILAKTAKIPNQAGQRSFTEQIKVLGTREPALRSDISAMLERMRQAANQSPAPKAAAEDQNQ